MQNLMFKIFPVAFTVFFASSMYSGNLPSTAYQPKRIWENVDYVGDSIVGHQMNIYLPLTGEGPFPVVVLIYGSAWFSNNLKDTAVKIMGRPLLEKAFAIVSVNHRSSREAIFPAQINDIKAAIRYIRANAKKYSLDTTFIGVTGYSSGGHLSALLGTSAGVNQSKSKSIAMSIEGNLGVSTQMSSKVNAVVDWFGPTDFLIMDSCGSSFKHDAINSPESWLVGGPIQENREKCELANPITYIDSKDPPFLILHGDDDKTVPLCQSVKLDDALQKNNVRSKLILVEKGGHGPGVFEQNYFNEMVQFFITEYEAVKK
jgi:acetyl esterase/lipase